MKLSRHKLFKRLLLAAITATTLTWQGGVVHADADFEHPDNPSNNTIEVNASNYILNGTTFNYSGYFGQGFRSDVYGGMANSGDVSGNTFTFNMENTGWLFVYGGATGSGNVFNNTLNFNAGNFIGALGGYTENGNVSNNTINISGGTFRNDTYPSVITVGAGTGEVSGNMINIWGSPDLSSAYLYGYSNSFNNSRNMLNIASPIIAYNIMAFNNINFFIPASMTNGGTMLTLTDSSGTWLGGTAIRAAMQGGSNLDTGDTVTLIQSAGTIITDNSTTYGKMTQAEYDAIKDRLPSGMLSDGVSLNYEMTVEKSGDNAIIARIGNTTDEETIIDTPTDTTDNSGGSDDNGSDDTDNTIANDDSSNNGSNNNGGSDDNGGGNGGGINVSGGGGNGGHTLPQTEVISEAAVVPTIHLVGFMSDKLVDWLPPRSSDFADEEEDSTESTANKIGSFDVFISGGGGSFRNKTGDGSYINSTVKGLDGGFGRTLEYASGPLVFAPIFEYATGNYDSYLSDGTHGKGSTKYIAGGLIGRKTFKSGFYIEASARLGKSERDFHSDTMTSRGVPVYTHYNKTSAPIFAGHLRVGKQLRLNKNNLLDVYGIYFHTHQGDMDIRLHENGVVGEKYHFDSVNAGKARLGYRLTTRTSKISRIYTGLAFQYEHSSSAVGTYKGRRTPGGGNHGASGMLELGWLIKPNKNNPWMLDLNATGFVGHQQGVSATVKLQKEF